MRFLFAVHNSTYYLSPSVARTALGGLPLVAPGGANGSKIRVAYAKLTGGDQTLAQDDFVNLFDLPANALPMFQKYNAAVGSGFGASVTLDVGTIDRTAAATVDENKFESAADVHAAGAGAALNWAVVDDSAVIANPTTVRAKFEGANPADDQDFEYWLIYAELN